MTRHLAECALVGARGALLIREMVRVDASQTHRRTDALLDDLRSVGETLEHARDLFPLAGAPVHELEQTPRLLVRRIETDGLLETLRFDVQLAMDGQRRQLRLVQTFDEYGVRPTVAAPRPETTTPFDESTGPAPAQQPQRS